MNYSLAKMGKNETYQPIYDRNTIISTGMSVKLIFKLDTTQDATIDAERLWVTVTDINGATMTGKLDNHPFYVDLKDGDTVHFLKQNIFDIYTD